jgi:hypothetical protein
MEKMTRFFKLDDRHTEIDAGKPGGEYCMEVKVELVLEERSSCGTRLELSLEL